MDTSQDEVRGFRLRSLSNDATYERGSKRKPRFLVLLLRVMFPLLWGIYLRNKIGD